MSKITIASSLLLLTGVGATVFLTSAEAENPPLAPDPVVIAPADDPVIDPLAEFDLDPERARSGITVRWNNGARTAERLRTVPELALLAEQAPAILDAIAGLREGALAWDANASVSREEIVAQYRLHHDMLRLSPAEQIERTDQFLAAQMELAKVRREQQDDSPMLPFLGALHGWVECANTETMTSITAALSQPSSILGFLSSVEHPDGWVLGDGAAKIVPQGSRLVVHPQRHQVDADLVACLDHRSAPDADLELTNWFDTGLPGSGFRNQGITQLHVTPDGLRFSSTTTWQTTQQRADAAAWPRVDPARFDAIPAQAFLACVVPLSAAATAQSVSMQTTLRGLDRVLSTSTGTDQMDEAALAKVEGIITAIKTTIPQIDGTCVLWVEPGMPVPTVTLEIDLPRSAADALIANMGEPVAADGSISETNGFVSAALGWRDGRLIFTTVPGGLDAIDRSGGFTTHPEVQSAFAAMTKHHHVSVILRPAAFAAYVAPFAAMAGPEWTQRLLTYEERLSESSASAFFTIATDDNAMHMDASGVLSLVAGAVLQAIAQNPLGIN